MALSLLANPRLEFALAPKRRYPIQSRPNHWQCRLRVIHVGIAKSALLSAMHNTRTFGRPTESSALVVFLRPICNRPPQLPRSDFGRCSEHDVLVPRPKVPHKRTTAAMNLHRNCCRAASPGFCQIAIWRSTAQERRGVKRRSSDGKIKAAACGTVGRQNRTNRSDSWRSVCESMTACHFAQLIEQSRLCAPRVFRPKLQQARSHDRLARGCRTAAGPSRLALCTTGAAGLRP
jgi:hypothetical protein